MRKASLAILFAVLGSVVQAQSPATAANAEYLVVATNRTSTMQDEMNQATEAGYRFMAVMGGDTAFGGSEVVVIMAKDPARGGQFNYRLLATSRTSTMQKEMQEAGDAGYEYRGQTIFKTTLGGRETVVILERDTSVDTPRRYEYRLLATNRTSTMQNELRQAAEAGFEFVGMTVASTRFGGDEVISILRKGIADR